MIHHGKIHILLISAFIVLTISCRKPLTIERSSVLAEVGNSVLYQSDLERDYSEFNLDSKDSIQFTSVYINDWIKQQLLVNEATKCLEEYQEELDIKLEKYRQELLIHQFKKQRTNEIINSPVSNNQVQEYYEQNLNLFVLDHAIVQVKYIILPGELEVSKKFKGQLLSTRHNDITEREDFIFKYAKKYDNFNNKWIYFDDIKELTQSTIENDALYLKSNQLIEYSNDAEHHIVVITNYTLSGDLAPLEFVKPRITSFIINEKKLDFLREIKDSLYNDALKYNKFRVFNK